MQNYYRNIDYYLSFNHTNVPLPMAKLSLLLDMRNNNTDRFPLVIRVSHKRKWKYLQTGYRPALNEWNDRKKQVKNPYLNSVRAKSFEDVINMILRFHGSDDLLISDINEIFLEDLEADYVGNGNKLNGLGVRLRAIRRIYNLAIKDKETELSAKDYPFGRGGYSIKTEKSRKRAVKMNLIEQIRNLNYSEGSSIWHHRNYFLFMFNMRGMNFIDLAFLRMDAISEGWLKYKRRKTKRGQNVKEFDIKVTSEASSILKYYSKGKRKNDLVFPILEDVIDSDNDLRLFNRLCNHNRRLITIGKAIGLEEHLTTYVARHTFATAGLHKSISKAQLGDMLGHTSYYTTEAYFDEFDKEILDDAADQILG